ncbi:hypothetical protein GCM10020218_099450 [Dactylosporangium vinaceum]
MSSRAIRKLQKLREQELQQAEQEPQDSSEDDEPVSRPSKPKLNAFDLLNAANDEEGGDDDEQQSESEVVAPGAPSTQEVTPSATTDSGKKKKKKGKNKKKKNTAMQEPTEDESNDKDLDEIDRVLKELAVQSKRETAVETPERSLDDSFPRRPEDFLHIDSKSLNATNEMRKLFGNVVLENFDQADSGSGRRRDRARETIDLGRALTGRYSPASRGQSLAGVTQRRNILFQGKDEWPRAPSGGLGMELTESLANGAAIYKFLHNTAYQDVQQGSSTLRGVNGIAKEEQLLQYNLYHIQLSSGIGDSKSQGEPCCIQRSPRASSLHTLAGLVTQFIYRKQTVSKKCAREHQL